MTEKLIGEIFSTRGQGTRVGIKKAQMSMAFHGWGCEQYGRHAFEQPLGSQTVLWLMHIATMVHNIQVQDE